MMQSLSTAQSSSRREGDRSASRCGVRVGASRAGCTKTYVPNRPERMFGILFGCRLCSRPAAQQRFTRSQTDHKQQKPHDLQAISMRPSGLEPPPRIHRTRPSTEPPRRIQSRQGPQPCASTNSATGAGSGEYSPAELLGRWHARSLDGRIGTALADGGQGRQSTAGRAQVPCRAVALGGAGRPSARDARAETARPRGAVEACIRPRTALLYEHMFVPRLRPARSGTKRSWI